MHLLLTHGYFLGEDPKEHQIMKPYAPLGLLYLSAYLRAQGFDVEIYDSTFGSQVGALTVSWRREPPIWLGIYGNLMTRGNVLAIVERARGVPVGSIVLGGPEPANYAEEYLAAGAEMWCRAKANCLWSSCCRAIRLRTGASTAILPVAVNRAPASTLIPNLDSQPWPDRERIDMGRYLAAWRERHGAGSVSLITARGCPYHCRWCSHSTFGKTHRRRSAASVADEVEWILDRYQPEMLWLADDVFTIHPGWTLAYAAEMKRRGMRVPFECITRADRFSAPVAAALAEMGCFRVWIGSESGSQRMLDAMQRGVQVEQVRDSGAFGASPRHSDRHVFHVGLRGREIQRHRGHAWST